jgi:signal transduction histidine kinase
MERPRILRGCLLWAGPALPALTADGLGLNEPRGLWQQLAGLGVLAAAVTVARRQPLAAFGAVAVLCLAAAPALFTVSYGPALAVLALLLGLRAARVRPAALAFAAVGCAGAARIALFGVDPAPEAVVLTGTLLFGCVFPWLGGRYWRQSRELAEAGWTRAARLEDEQRGAEERARLRERSRIAQDMHDSLGHELSLLALRAGALQVAPDLPAHHRAAAADLRVAAADATDRLHRIIGVLREDDEPVPLSPAGEGAGGLQVAPGLPAGAADPRVAAADATDRLHGISGVLREDDEPVPPAPAGESVEQLVARTAESGLAVRWESNGSGTGGGVAERILYRVVREALTNAARHAPGAAVVVAASGTAVTITNGRATGGSSRSPSGGSGLLGLRAAVTSAGGDFEAGPLGDGFRVRAYVPEQPTATSPRTAAPSAPFTRARRRVVHAIGAAAGAGVVLVGGAFGWYAYTETHSVLPPAAYAELRLGAPADEVARVLPDRTVRDAPVDRAPAQPRDTDCRYYRASGELLVSVDHFRLCFDDEGRLAAKDVIPRAGLSGAGPFGDGREEFVR